MTTLAHLAGPLLEEIMLGYERSSSKRDKKERQESILQILAMVVNDLNVDAAEGWAKMRSEVQRKARKQRRSTKPTVGPGGSVP